MKNLIALILVLLVGCGGGGQATAEDPIVVRMHGDSTQQGARTGGVNAATQAQEILRAMGRGDVAVIGEGVGGTTTQLRLEGGLTKNGDVPLLPWARLIATAPADIVTFKYGINDARYYSAAMFRANVNRLVDLSEAAGMSVILETPSPVDAVENPEFQERIEANVEVIRAIAGERPSVTLCDHWEYGLRVGYENRDGFHPTARAYQEWIGPEAARCILRAVKRR